MISNWLLNKANRQERELESAYNRGHLSGKAEGIEEGLQMRLIGKPPLTDAQAQEVYEWLMRKGIEIGINPYTRSLELRQRNY